MQNDYERQLSMQNTTIGDLEQQITTMKSFYECDKSISTNSSSANCASVALDSDKCYSMDDIHSIRDEECFRRMNPLREVHSVDVIECKDPLIPFYHNNNNNNNNNSVLQENRVLGLSDREVRRISYKIAEGSWKRLANSFPVGQDKLDTVAHLSCAGHEKIYQLVSCWATEGCNVPRNILLEQLEGYVDSNRKDVVKFLRQMTGVEVKDKNSIRNKLKKFKLSTKR